MSVIIYEKALRDCDKFVDQFIRNQQSDPNKSYYGNSDNSDTMGEVGAVVYGGSITIYLSAYFNEKSKHYKSQNLLSRVILAFDFMDEYQRPDGTFDLPICNYYSSPDTAFLVNGLLDAYNLVQIYADDEVIKKQLSERLKKVMMKGAEALKKCGFHTPNHRWVVSAALTRMYNVTGDSTYMDTAHKYFAEGIDCNEYGEYTERSAGMYNYINDKAMMYIGEALKDPQYFEYMKRNLKMMFSYIEDDISIFTMNSTRQDYGTTVYAFKYYPLYLYMAERMQDGQFYTMVKKMEEKIFKMNYNICDQLYFLMLYPKLIDFQMEPQPLPVTENNFYEDSGVVRMKQNNFSVTLLKDNADVLHIRNGGMNFFLRIGFGFFNDRYFIAKEIAQSEGGYTLTYDHLATYYLPFENPPASSNWNEMDRESRDQYHPCHLFMDLNVKLIEDGVKIHVTSKGCDNIPVRFELNFSEGGFFETDYAMGKATSSTSFVFKKGYLTVDNGKESLIAGPAFAEHRAIEPFRDSLPESDKHFTAYFTAYSDLDNEFTIIKGRS